jgi:hypothetical protein
VQYDWLNQHQPELFSDIENGDAVRHGEPGDMPGRVFGGGTGHVEPPYLIGQGLVAMETARDGTLKVRDFLFNQDSRGLR